MPPHASSAGWCTLRKIKLHSDFAAFAFCHHWTHREPLLPIVEEKNLGSEQLDFARDLSINDK